MDSVLCDQAKPVELALVLRAALDEIDARCFNRTVAEHVRELHNVTIYAVVRRCEQVPQIVRKHLRRRNARLAAQPLHGRPDLPPVHAFSARGEKNLAVGDFLLFGVFQQLAAELRGQQNRANLALQCDLGTAASCGFHGEKLHLADADTGRADALHQQRKPSISAALRGGEQTGILRARQLSLRCAEDAVLDFQKFCAAVLPAEEAEQAVQRGKRGVDGGRGLMLPSQMCLPFRHGILRDRRAAQPRGEGSDAAQIFFPRSIGSLLLPQSVAVLCEYDCR